MVKSHPLGSICGSLFIFFAAFIPSYSQAQVFLGSFDNPERTNSISVHIALFEGQLYTVFTHANPAGECRRLEAATLSDATINPAQLCGLLYDPGSINVLFKVSAQQRGGTVKQIGLLDTCYTGSPTKQPFRYQLSYLGFDQGSAVLKERAQMDLEEFLSLPICKDTKEDGHPLG